MAWYKIKPLSEADDDDGATARGPWNGWSTRYIVIVRTKKVFLLSILLIPTVRRSH